MYGRTLIYEIIIHCTGDTYYKYTYIIIYCCCCCYYYYLLYKRLGWYIRCTRLALSLTLVVTTWKISTDGSSPPPPPPPPSPHTTRPVTHCTLGCWMYVQHISVDDDYDDNNNGSFYLCYKSVAHTIYIYKCRFVANGGCIMGTPIQINFTKTLHTGFLFFQRSLFSYCVVYRRRSRDIVHTQYI